MRREYRPKPLGPRQEIEWIGADGRARTGIVWSEGPEANSRWARDENGEMTAVKLPSKKYAARGHFPREIPRYCSTWQRDTLRRCENLRGRTVFAEQQAETRYSYGRGNVTYHETVAYHCDRGCAAIAHETRPCYDWEPTAGSVTRMLLDGTAGDGKLCRACIYLAEPGA
jgi:hypothetical protein